MVSHKDYSSELNDAYPDRGHPVADPQPGFVPGTTQFLARADLGDVGYIQCVHAHLPISSARVYTLMICLACTQAAGLVPGFVPSPVRYTADT